MGELFLSFCGSRRARTLTLAGAVLITLSSPDVALAQASRLGDTFGVPYIAISHMRFPEIAFDPVNNVYLTVAGVGSVGGAFVTADGVPIGSPFQIGRGGTAQTPSVAYSPDARAFLVAWLEWQSNNQSSVWGQLFSYGAGGAATAVTPQFLIASAPGGAHSESAPAIAYSTTSREFLVAWMQGIATRQWDIRAQRVSNTGQLLGSEIVLTADGTWQAQPGIGYNPVTDEFYVAWSAEAANVASIDAQRVKAGTGALLGGRATLATGPFLTLPKIQYNSATGKLFVVWYYQEQKGLYGRLINADGTFDGNIIPLNTTYFAYDATHQAYNAVSNTFFVVTHAGSVDSPEDFGFEVSALGNPSPGFQVTVAAGTGNFYPAIAAHATRAEWMTITAHSMATIAGQRIHTATRDTSGTPGQPPPPPPPSSTYTLTVQMGANGGTVVMQQLAAGVTFGISVTPPAGTIFNGWDYSSNGDCLDSTVTMNANMTCVATFVPILGAQQGRAFARGVDMSGDGAGDVFLFKPSTGDWFVAHNDTSGGFAYTQGKWGDKNLTMKAAQLNNDARADLVLYNATTGAWYQAISTGLGAFTYTSGNWGPGWTLQVGRFNADAFDDVFLYRPTTGEWAIRCADGAGSFSNARFLFSPPTWNVTVVDLNGDGASDLFLYDSNTGEWWKGFNQGFDENGTGGFGWSDHGTWSPGWTVKAGDFDGDGNGDLFVYNTATGYWYLCLSTTPSAFHYHGGRWSPGWQLYVANLNADAFDDLFVYNPVMGNWYECFSNGVDGFTVFGSSFHDQPTWDLTVTELNGDGLSDLFIYNPATGAWHKGFNVKGVNPAQEGGFIWSAQGTWSPGYTVVAGR